MRLPGGEARARVLSRQCAGGDPVLYRTPPPPEPGYVGFRQPPPAAGHEDIAKKLRGLRCGQDDGLAWMQLQSATFEQPCDPALPLGQHARIVMEQRKVIDIAQVRRAQDFGAEMIERVEIEIGEELAREIADRQAAPARERRKQVIAGKVQFDRLLRVRGVNDPVEEVEGRHARDAAAQVALQYAVIDRREVPEHVAAQDMGIKVPVPLIGLNGAVRAFAGPVGKAVIDEAALEDRGDHITDGVMHDPVAERRRRYDPVLGIEELDLHIPSRPVGAVRQCTFKRQAFFFEIGEEGGRAGLAAFAERGAACGSDQGIKLRNRAEETRLTPWHVPGRHPPQRT